MKKYCLFLLFALLAGCGNIDVDTYANETPALHLQDYFNGRVDGWGMFQNRSGQVIKRFHVVVNGTVKGNQLILDEDFTYSDGTKQKRVWTLTAGPDGTWTGTAGDVVGQASGKVAGNTLHWQYVLRLPVDGTEYDMHLDDWMYLIDQDTLTNRSLMTKFGIEVGQVTLFFRKQR